MEACHGEGGSRADSLLETYHTECWPVGNKVLNFTDKLFSTMTSQSGWVAGIRNMLLPIFGAVISRSGTVALAGVSFCISTGDSLSRKCVRERRVHTRDSKRVAGNAPVPGGGHPME